MASSAPTKHEFLVILPDNAGAIERRMKVRSDHLGNLKPKESNFWVLGGATLDERIQEGQPPKINGSIMLAVAENEEQVLAELKKDVYSTENVWDWDKVQIFPFRSAFRYNLDGK